MKSLVLLSLAACGHGATTDHLAVGWRGPLPTWNGACPAGSDMTAAVQSTPDGHYLAVHEGATDFACARGTVRLEVRTPTQLVIRKLDTIHRGATLILEASVADAKGPLALGEADVAWTLPPGLREGDRCRHTSGTCLNASSQRVIADTAGTFTVDATFGGLHGRTTLVVGD